MLKSSHTIYNPCLFNHKAHTTKKPESTNWTLLEEASGIEGSELRGTELLTEKQSLSAVFCSELQDPFSRGRWIITAIVSGAGLGGEGPLFGLSVTTFQTHL